MSDALSQRRMIENEGVFRRYNERVRKNFEEIIEEAKESGQEYLVPKDDTALHFYCECSDENCRQRIHMKPSIYHKIHNNRRHFVLIPGHETNLIEQIVRREASYHIVEKFSTPSESVRTLSPTGVDNS